MKTIIYLIFLFGAGCTAFLGDYTKGWDTETGTETETETGGEESD